MSETTRAAHANDLLKDFRGGGLLWPLLLTVAVHAVVILATSLPWLQAAVGGGKADLTEEQRLDAAVKEATASLQAIAKEHGIRPQDLGSRFSAGGKPVAAPSRAVDPGAAAPTPPPPAGDAPATNAWGAAGQPAAAAPNAAAPAKDAAAPPPGPVIPDVKEDVDLFK